MAYHLDVRPALDNWQVSSCSLSVSSLSRLLLLLSVTLPPPPPLCLASSPCSSLQQSLSRPAFEAWGNTAVSCSRPVKCAWSACSPWGVALVFLTPVVSWHLLSPVGCCGGTGCARPRAHGHGSVFQSFALFCVRVRAFLSAHVCAYTHAWVDGWIRDASDMRACQCALSNVLAHARCCHSCPGSALDVRSVDSNVLAPSPTSPPPPPHSATVSLRRRRHHHHRWYQQGRTWRQASRCHLQTPCCLLPPTCSPPQRRSLPTRSKE